MAVDIQKLFNEELPAALAKNAEDAKQIGAKYQINITGDGGGEWFIDVSRRARREAGNRAAPTARSRSRRRTSRSSSRTRRPTACSCSSRGKLKVAGNQMLAMKLQKLFTL